MRRLSLALLLVALPAWAQLPERVTLDDVLRLAEKSPRVTVSQREADMARAERSAAGALPNPTLSLGRSTPSNGERTVFDASSQQQATIEVPVPVFGQRGARVHAADLGVTRAESAVQLSLHETRRLAALAYVRLVAASEQVNARRAALADVERLRGLVSGREASGMASKYDLARADAEVALVRLGLNKSLNELSEQSATLAGLLGVTGWRPQPVMSLSQLQENLGEAGDLAGNPALRVARDETAAAEARVQLARRERYPVPAIQLGRTWTTGPYGAANFVGLASEVPILDTRRAQVDRASAEYGATRERERGVVAAVSSELQKQRELLGARREALARFEREVFERQASFLEMAESAYRLGRGTLFELLDARRTQLEATLARVELLGALVESQVELRALSGSL